MQAKKSLGNTKDNPSVGCVIIKDSSVVSAACTSFNGRPHAERNAISSLNNSIKNSLKIASDPNGYAKELYAKLSYAESHYELIYLEVPEKRSLEWEPVWDRITRAGKEIDSE